MGGGMGGLGTAAAVVGGAVVAYEVVENFGAIETFAGDALGDVGDGIADIGADIGDMF